MTIICICIGIAFIMPGLYYLYFKIKRPECGKESRAAGSIRYIPADEVMIRYGSYKLSMYEWCRYTLLAAAALAAVGYIFFKSIYICIFLCAFSFLYPIMKRSDLLKKRKAKLGMQFKDALYSVSSSLSAGKSLEMAFKAALEDLRLLYPEETAYIIKEFELINRKVEMNETIDRALSEFAKRADIEDITNFVYVLTICRSTGGNLVEVIKNTTGIINQKIEIKNEIDVLVAEQKFSQKILNVMPFAVIVLISAGSPDYIQPMYEAKGHAVMLVVLLLLVLSYYIGSKIMDIKV